MHETPCAIALVNQSRIENFESWQRRQNGDLNEIRQEMQTSHSLLDQRITKIDERINDRITSLERWIMGTLLAAMLGFGTALINLLSK